MKSILTVFGCFIFSLFIEGFSRIIIIFYHKQELEFFGYLSLPGWQWTLIIGLSIFLSTWIAAMLIVTITDFKPFNHLSAFFILIVLWRVSEFQAMGEFSNIWYSIGLVIVQAISLGLALITKNKMNANTAV